MKKLYKDSVAISGVCSGIAVYFGVNKIFVRILFVIFFPYLFLGYIYLAIFLRPAPDIILNDTPKNAPKPFKRSIHNKLFAGICGGISEKFNIDVNIIRAILLTLYVFNSFVFFIYIIAIFIIPTENDTQYNN